jgi:hypothetical protein
MVLRVPKSPPTVFVNEVVGSPHFETILVLSWIAVASALPSNQNLKQTPLRP